MRTKDIISKPGMIVSDPLGIGSVFRRRGTFGTHDLEAMIFLIEADLPLNDI